MATKLLDEPAYLTIGKARQALGVSRDTVERLVESGALRPMRLGPHGWRRFSRDEIAELIERYRENGGGKDVAA